MKYFKIKGPRRAKLFDSRGRTVTAWACKAEIRHSPILIKSSQPHGSASVFCLVYPRRTNRLDIHAIVINWYCLPLDKVTGRCELPRRGTAGGSTCRIALIPLRQASSDWLISTFSTHLIFFGCGWPEHCCSSPGRPGN